MVRGLVHAHRSPAPNPKNTCPTTNFSQQIFQTAYLKSTRWDRYMGGFVHTCCSTIDKVTGISLAGSRRATTLSYFLIHEHVSKSMHVLSKIGHTSILKSCLQGSFPLPASDEYPPVGTFSIQHAFQSITSNVPLHWRSYCIRQLLVLPKTRGLQLTYPF